MLQAAKEAHEKYLAYAAMQRRLGERMQEDITPRAAREEEKADMVDEGTETTKSFIEGGMMRHPLFLVRQLCAGARERGQNCLAIYS